MRLRPLKAMGCSTRKARERPNEIGLVVGATSAMVDNAKDIIIAGPF